MPLTLPAGMFPGAIRRVATSRRVSRAVRRVAASRRVALALAGRVLFGTRSRIMLGRLRWLLYRRLACRRHRLLGSFLTCGFFQFGRADAESNRRYQEKYPHNNDQKVQLFHAVLLLRVD